MVIFHVCTVNDAKVTRGKLLRCEKRMYVNELPALFAKARLGR
jgi:hypothetical protein